MRCLRLMPSRTIQTCASLSARGFTLLEVLVVLVIIGLGLAVAGPRLTTAYASISFAMERESFEQALADLPYQAYSTRRDLVLGEIKSPDPGARSLRQEPSKFELWTGLEQVKLEIPADWRVEVREPIIYRASGYCGGGRLTVTVGDYSERFVLLPPLCRPQIDVADRR